MNNVYSLHPQRPGLLSRSRMVSIQLPVNCPAGTYSFNAQNDLIGMRITRIQSQSSEVLAFDPNYQSNKVIDKVDLPNVVVTFQTIDPASEKAANTASKTPGVPGQQGNYIQNVPLLSMYDYSSGDGIYERHPFLVNSVRVIWEQCSVIVLKALTNATPVSVVLNFYYTSSNYDTFDARSGTAFNTN